MRNIEIYGDCLYVMGHIGDESVDMILADLPYGTTNRNKWDEVIPFAPLWEHYERVIKPNGAIVLTAAEPFTSMLITSRPKLFRYDLIWEKSTAQGFLNANRMPLRAHESILVFYKKLPTYNPQFTEGKPYTTVRGGDTSNYGEIAEIHWKTENEGKRYPRSVVRFSQDRGFHPTQKPVALFEYLIKTYTNPGELVLDNVAGSGTTAIACMRTGRDYIVIEKSAQYYIQMMERIKNESTDTSPAN